MILSYDRTQKYASEAGFTLCGVARARVLSEYAPRYEAALGVSGEAALGYLARGWRRRLDPQTLMPRAQSVVVCAVNYRNHRSRGYEADFPAPKVASYALSDEYQPKIKSMLGQVLERLQGDYAGLRGRAVSDTSAILEKAWAVEAGLGFVGRNSLLVNPLYGSFLMLGELVLDAPFDRYDEPYRGVGCGACRRCARACPAGALTPVEASGVCAVDTGRCISALTIERAPEPSTPEKPHQKPYDRLHGWIFGCDECQIACPYNRADPPDRPDREAPNPLFAPLWDPADFLAVKWLAMDDDEFHTLFGASPLARAGLARIKKMVERAK